MTTTVHEFEVGEGASDLHALGLEPVSIDLTFGEGATFVLRQAKDHHFAVLEPGQRVAYKADSTYRFVGEVRSIQRRTQDDSVSYIAQDALGRASSISVSAIIESEIGSLTISGSVGDVLKLAIESAGLKVGTGFDALTNAARGSSPFYGSLSDLIRQVMTAQPQHRLIVNYAGGGEVIDAVRIHETGDVQTLNWGGQAALQDDLVGRVADLDISESVDGCYTAVEVIQPEVQSGSSVVDKEVVLSEGWDHNKTSTWNVEKSGVLAALNIGNFNPDSEDWLVYRAWQLGSSIDDFDPELSWRFMVKVPAKPRFGTNSPVWQPIDAHYFERAVGNTVERFIIATHPVTVGGDARIPGKARGPEEAKLLYQAEVGGSTPALSVRAPSAGFEGTAFTRYGVENTRRIEVNDLSEVSATRARQSLDALKDVKHTGQVQVYGRMPSWAWTGGSAVRVEGLTESGNQVLSQYQAIPFTQTGWSMDFASNLFAVQVTDDRSQFADLERIS